MGKYTKWVEENANDLIYVRNDERSKSIVAVYFAWFSLRSLTGGDYILDSSADTFAQLKKCFKKYGFTEGIEWANMLETAYGMPLHASSADRIAYVLGSEEVQERLEKMDDEGRDLSDALVSKLEEFLDEVVEKEV